jgi:hypothetical protein
MSFQDMFKNMDFKTANVSQLNPRYQDFKELSKDETEAQRLSVIEQQLNNQYKSFDTYIGDTSIKTYTDFVYGTISTVKPIRLQNYRRMSQFPEVGDAIDEIADTAINYDDKDKLIHLRIRDDKVKQVQSSELQDSWEEYISLFELDENIFDYIRTFIIEGSLAWENIIDEDDKEAGIVGVNFIPTESYDFLVNMKGEKMGISVSTDTGLVSISRTAVGMQGGIQMQTAEDFMKSKDQKEKQQEGGGAEGENITLSELKGIPLPWEQITYCDSGSYNPNRLIVYPVLERARKAFRQLSLIEDTIIIYRLARAPVRYVFNVDTGDMNRNKAEEEVYKLMKKYQTKQFYNPETGSVSNTYNPHSLLECIVLDTKIPLIDGRMLTLNEIIEEYNQGKTLYAKSCNPENGEQTPGLISWAGVTRRNAELVKVTFDNGKHQICTPDHKFPTWFNGEVEAQNLTTDHFLFGVTDVNVASKMKIISVEKLDYREDTGTLTIDQNHAQHNYHNFATKCGIYLKNSFWFPKPNGSGGTTVSTLETPTALWSELPDLEYFLRKLYRSLKVPFRRFKEATLNVEKGATISYEEYKFAKFVMRILDRIAGGFKYGYKQHLKLKGLWETYDLSDHDFNVKFTPPAMFDLYEQQKLIEMKFKNYDTVTRDHPEFSKRLAMRQCLGYSDDYIEENFKYVDQEAVLMAAVKSKTNKIEAGENPYAPPAQK